MSGWMGSATRYDPNAYLIVEGDLKPVRHDLLNIGLAGWNTHFSAPYTGAAAQK